MHINCSFYFFKSLLPPTKWKHTFRNIFPYLNCNGRFMHFMKYFLNISNHKRNFCFKAWYKTTSFSSIFIFIQTFFNTFLCHAENSLGRIYAEVAKPEESVCKRGLKRSFWSGLKYFFRHSPPPSSLDKAVCILHQGLIFEKNKIYNPNWNIYWRI